MSKIISLADKRAEQDRMADDAHAEWMRNRIAHIRSVEDECRSVRIEMEAALAAWLEGGTP